VQLADTGRVTALMTAESIIVALLIAYAPTINNTLVTLMKRREPIFGTVLAGLLISAVALTAFRSLLLLYKSIDISNVDDVMRSDENYRAGYDLFLMVILGSGVYVLSNAFSIVHYAIWRSNVVFSCVPVSPSELSSIETPNIEVAGIFIGVWVILSVFRPFHVTRFFRCIRDNLGTCLLPYSVILAVSTAILAVISGVQGTKWWPWCSWSVWPSLAVFGSLTIAALWMLMIPEQERRRGET
jgi:hypothetical protein